MNTRKSNIFILFTASLIHLHAFVCAMIIRPSYETENFHFLEKVDAINKIIPSVSMIFLLLFNFAVSTQALSGHYISAKGTFFLR